MQGSKVSALDLVLNHYTTQAILKVYLVQEPISRSIVPCPLRSSLDRSFLSLVAVLPTVAVTGSYVSFSWRRVARCSVTRTRCIVRFFLLPPTYSLHCSFVSRAHVFPVAPLPVWLILSPADDTPAALLAKSLVSFSRRRHTRRTAP
jgi:hypothetical protein